MSEKGGSSNQEEKLDSWRGWGREQQREQEEESHKLNLSLIHNLHRQNNSSQTLTLYPTRPSWFLGNDFFREKGEIDVWRSCLDQRR